MLRKLTLLMMLLAAPMAQARVVMQGCGMPAPAAPVQQNVSTHDCCPSEQKAEPADSSSDCCDLTVDLAAADSVAQWHLDAGTALAPLPPQRLAFRAQSAVAHLPTGPPPVTALQARYTYLNTARLRV